MGLPKKIKNNWSEGDLQEDKNWSLRGLKRLWWKLVELLKKPSVVGCARIFKKADDVPMFEEVKVEACGTT